MKNKQSLTIQMSKEAIDIPLEIMEEVFNFRGEIGYDLGQKEYFQKKIN